MAPANHKSDLEVYVEKMSVFFGMETRMPHSIARVLSHLLVSEPPYQSTNQIAASLQLSAGSVNNAVNMLLQAGLVKRVTLTGDRHYYYESNPAGWKQVMLLRLQSIHHGVALAEEGMKLSKDSARLKAMYDTYTIFESEAEKLIERLNAIG